MQAAHQLGIEAKHSLIISDNRLLYLTFPSLNFLICKVGVHVIQSVLSHKLREDKCVAAAQCAELNKTSHCHCCLASRSRAGALLGATLTA